MTLYRAGMFAAGAALIAFVVAWGFMPSSGWPHNVRAWAAMAGAGLGFGAALITLAIMDIEP